MYTYSDAAYPHPQPGWSPDIAAKTLCIGLWYEALDHRRWDIFWSRIFSWYHLLNPTPSNIKHIFQSDNDDPTLIWYPIFPRSIWPHLRFILWSCCWKRSLENFAHWAQRKVLHLDILPLELEFKSNWAKTKFKFKLNEVQQSSPSRYIASWIKT